MQNCPYAKKCGGCQLQNMTYEKQLSHKQVKVIRLVGKLCHVEEIMGMETPTRYRNKATHAFCSQRGKLVSGLYQSATDRILPVEDCLLERENVQSIVKTVKRLCLTMNIPAYDEEKRKGFLRTVLVRESFSTGEVMVVLVSGSDKFRGKEEFTQALLQLHPEITTLLWNVNFSDTTVFLGQKTEILHGTGYLTDTLCGLSFRISPKSFYQINPLQTEVLYGKALEYAGLTGRETVVDAYCGTGTIGLTMAKDAREIIGVESNADAVRDAMENAIRNGIKNARFICKDAGQFLTELAKSRQKVDVVITDPPRAGCSKEFLQSLLALAPKKVVYVSCNPETLARDLFVLSKNGYRIKKVQPVDMFPGTGHVECVVMLSRKIADDYVRISVHTKDLQAKAN